MSGCGTTKVSPYRELKRIATSRVELDVLALVLTDRHEVGVIEQDVRRLQDRIIEQCRRNAFFLPARLVLELRHPAQLAVLRHGIQHPTSSVCSRTSDWRKRIDCLGSIPAASSVLAIVSVFSSRIAGCRQGDRMQINDAEDVVVHAPAAVPSCESRPGSCRCD